ncbi:hypothetical protein SS50377_23124 [Spironucleus salmonicida]|uniref:Uncharacterized protein n=1 Tax=Spironucleus salmonicida TaxID=348837 RepID=V6LB87_9EUKA|nr:hypothetical protein SS50377_23124 [Spironucleus salmonicida]|eukprot:EST41700.1 Hypothetical protein SS50377_18787 [Spironucleus salmonicida]
MSKKTKMFIPIKMVDDQYQLNGSISIQTTLPSSMKKMKLIKPNFSLEQSQDSETSQTEIVDLSAIDIEKRRLNAKKSLDEAKQIIDKLINGDAAKETKKKKIETKAQNAKQELELNIQKGIICGGSVENTEQFSYTPRKADNRFYNLWLSCQ